MITCGIATLKDREEAFRVVVDSIHPQVDRIYAVLNLYDEIPEWMKLYPKVVAIIGHNTFSDSGKVLFAGAFDSGYYLTLDDDLIVPEGYVEYMIGKIREYNCIVTLHGKRYPRQKIKSFLLDAQISLRVLCQCGHDTKVTIGGSGCMAWDMAQFKISVEDFPLPHMADIWISLAAHRQGIKIMALAHEKGYIKHVDHGDNTIWHTYTKHNDLLLTTLVNSIL